MRDKVSVVTALYLSSRYIEEFFERHLACLRRLEVDYEFVFVVDGSPDDSESVVKRLMEANKDVKFRLITFSRNFGQHPAMFAGMAHAAGDYVYALDCDLEEDPENLTEMYRRIKDEADVDVVYGVLNRRSGGLFRNVFGKIFYLVLDHLSDVKVPHDQAWQRIMSRRYVDALLQYKEKETLPAGLMTLAGFRQLPLAIEKTYKGSTSYTFWKRLRLALNSITAFSARPLIFIGVMGLLITVVAFSAIAVAVFRKLSSYDYQAGWVSLIASIWLVGGLLLSSIGIIGIYLAKMFNQLKDRPLYLIKSMTSTGP